MKLLVSIIVVYLICVCSIQAQSLVQQLGYPEDAKLLILHADDLGIAHSENQATFDAFEKGMVNSASVIVPAPWFSEFVVWARQHPEADLGLHLTLTAEWDLLKWGPVAEQVPGLVNEQGYFYSNVRDVISHASVEEVEKEIRAQIERYLAAGLQPTHLDSHMGSLFNEKFFPVYIKMGQEYNMPVMINSDFMKKFPGVKPTIPENTLQVDQVPMAFPKNYQDGMKEFYSNTLRSLTAGVSVLLFHCAYDNDEMRAVTNDGTNYGADWRQQDFDFFTSDTCRKILQDENIQLITWRELGALLK